jgi:predicted RNase H-like HicB family nuclease
MIYEIKQYLKEVSNKEFVVTEKKPITDNGIENNIKLYFGTINAMTPRGVIPIPFEFPQGWTIEECFEKFEERAQIIIKQIEDASKIIPASGFQGNNGGLIIPKG